MRWSRWIPTAQRTARSEGSGLGGLFVTSDACLTLVDALDSFVVMGNRAGFETAVRQVIAHVSVDQDVKIQVLEVNVRMLGKFRLLTCLR
jgi:hypothetical protein